MAPEDNFFGDTFSAMEESAAKESRLRESRAITAGFDCERIGLRPRGFWAYENIHKRVIINVIPHFSNKKRTVYIFLPKVILMYNNTINLHV